MATKIRFPIPPSFIDFGLKILPIAIGIIGSLFRVNDYVFSGSFLRAGNLKSCCDTFDFIIVGAGSSGAAIAARLSEDSKVRVLLLDADGDPNPFTYIPAAVPGSLNHPETDWQYLTVPQNGSALGLINQQVAWPRGRGLGGSSNINFMIYNRGNARDFDRWAETTGDPRWRFENVEKYFLKMEDYYGVWDGSGYHGKGGPLRVEAVKYAPGLNYLLDAAKELGFEIKDLNQNQTQGFSPIDFTQKRGARFSTFRAYIKPNLHRPNLVIFRYSHVTKIHFDEALRAVGVTFIRHGVKGYAHANKEIIISAGAINSPQLLLLSGVGPRDHLIELRIPPVVDLPVGLNLQDHVTTIAGPFLINTTDSLLLHRDVDVGAVFDYLKDGSGPATSPLGITAIGLASTSFAPSPNWPDIMYTCTSLGVFDGLGQLIDERFNTGNNIRNFVAPYVGRDAHFVLISLGLPKSRGYIRLRDKNPLSKPLIDPRYFSDPENQDMKAMMEGVSLILKLYRNTTSFQRINATIPRSAPGCPENVPIDSPASLECTVRTLTVTLYHPTGTCAMGKVEDPNTVVDSQLRVKGVKGLRVADASVMPFVTNTNTNAPSIMIGEMLADMIKSDWNNDLLSIQLQQDVGLSA